MQLKDSVLPVAFPEQEIKAEFLSAGGKASHYVFRTVGGITFLAYGDLA